MKIKAGGNRSCADKEIDKETVCTFKMQRQKVGRRRCLTNRGQEVMSEQEKGSHTVKETQPLLRKMKGYFN